MLLFQIKNVDICIGYLDIGTIPSGARNVKIIETSPSAIIGIKTILLYISLYHLFVLALKLGNADILNEDFEMFSPGSYIVAAKDFNFVYNRSSSGMDVAFINGPLSEQLFIRVSYLNFVSLLVSLLILFAGICYRCWSLYTDVGLQDV